MTIITGGEVDAYPRRDPAVINEDNFNSGTCGWVPLISAQYPEGVLFLDSEISDPASRYSLFLQTGNGSKDGVSSNWGDCVAIKRCQRPQAAKKVYMEWKWSVGSEFDWNSPRVVIFGLDTCDANAVRGFFQFRYQNWDAGSSTRRQQYQMMHNSTWTDVPGGVYPHGINENKRNLIHTEAVFDLENHCYDGLRVNGLGFGSLAATPNTSLTAYGPAVESLPTFEGGFNPMFAVNNRNDSSTTHAWANLSYQRSVVVK